MSNDPLDFTGMTDHHEEESDLHESTFPKNKGSVNAIDHYKTMDAKIKLVSKNSSMKVS